MRTLQSLRESCADGEAFQTEGQPTINIPMAGTMVKVPTQKLIPVDVFYLFEVKLSYTIENSAPFVNGTDYVKIDIYTRDSSFTRIISTYYPHDTVQGMKLYTFSAMAVIYCFSGSVYGIGAKVSKPGTIDVSDMRTYIFFKINIYI